MYEKVLTIFNFDEQTETWFPSVAKNCHYTFQIANNNPDQVYVKVNINTDLDYEIWQPDNTLKEYKEFWQWNELASSYKEDFYTINPDKDFVVFGIPELEGLSMYDGDYKLGLIDYLNKNNVRTYKIQTANIYAMITHWELVVK